MLCSIPFATFGTVIDAHAWASDTCRVRKKIFSPTMVNIVISSVAPVYSANISVWPMNGIFAAFSNSLLIGAVTTPSTAPAHRQVDRTPDRRERGLAAQGLHLAHAQRGGSALSWCSTSMTPGGSARSSGPLMRCSRAVRPHTSSARSSTRASPITKDRDSSRTSGASSARTRFPARCRRDRPWSRPGSVDWSWCGTPRGWREFTPRAGLKVAGKGGNDRGVAKGRRMPSHQPAERLLGDTQKQASRLVHCPSTSWPGPRAEPSARPRTSSSGPPPQAKCRDRSPGRAGG